MYIHYQRSQRKTDSKDSLTHKHIFRSSLSWASLRRSYSYAHRTAHHKIMTDILNLLSFSLSDFHPLFITWISCNCFFASPTDSVLSLSQLILDTCSVTCVYLCVLGACFLLCSAVYIAGVICIVNHVA